MMTMKSELKQQWVTALRSGKYKQGEGALRDQNDQHCCLGVLCDLVDPTGWAPYYNDEEDEEYPDGYRYDNDSEALTRQLAEEIGFNSLGQFEPTMELIESLEGEVANETLVTLHNIICHNNRYEKNLAHLNDSGVPFEDIATIIEHVEFTPLEKIV
jgi:hypothetical protein